MQPKTTAKDFFVYLAGFVTLYVSAISLISLLFAIINKAFPDALNSAYYYGGDPYSSGMRMAIASLIIVFPIYIIIASYLNRYIRANTEKKDMGVRKWLTYLTLFITGVAVVVDLVVLVNTFLGGEITSRFVLKVLAVFIVSGVVFAYYLYDLRKDFTPNMPNRSKLLVTLACVFVFGTLVGGFLYLGSPTQARALKFDERRVNDLSSIQQEVVNYWQQKGELPKNLDDLANPISGYFPPSEPDKALPYVYEATGKNTFKLCAEFATESSLGVDSATSKPQYMGGLNENWKHAAGRVCFDRTIDLERYPVYKNQIPTPIQKY